MTVTDEAATTRGHIRGSSLLLSGRVLALLVKLVTQTLLVRHLATSAYGAWAYGLSAAGLLLGFANLSFDQSVSRFAAMYREQKRYGELFGMLLLAGVTVLAASALVMVPVLAAPGWVGRLTGNDAAIYAVLSVLVMTVPLGALDRVLVATFASFDRALAIFLRRYILGPVLQLVVVALFLLRGASLTFLAWGFVLSDLAGLVLYGGLLVRLFRREGLLAQFSLRSIKLPVREVLGFSLPLATSDWLSAFVGFSGVVALGYVYSTHHVALFRAVLPIAILNELVMQSFAMLFVPTASRLFARGDFDGVNLFYWRTTIWIAVLSFPIFAVTFALATPLAVLLFGARYAASGRILAILSLGVYLQAALGFNGTTLKVAGEVRFLVIINLLALALNAGLTVLLVPRYGAVGAAWTMTVTNVAFLVMKQVGLRRVPGVRAADVRFASSAAVVAIAVGALVVLRWTVPHRLLILGPATSLIVVVVLILTERSLRIGDVFPELRRLPFLRPLLP